MTMVGNDAGRSQGRKFLLILGTSGIVGLAGGGGHSVSAHGESERGRKAAVCRKW